MSVEVEVELCEESACEVSEMATILTEREEIALPVTASVVAAEDPSAPMTTLGGRPRHVRLLATAPRDPALGRTLPRTTRDVDAGTKRFEPPARQPEYVRPDFFAEPLSDGEEEAAPRAHP